MDTKQTDPTLDSLIADLARARTFLDAAQADYAAQRAACDALLLPYKDVRDAILGNVERLEDQLRAAALATGEKHPHPALTVETRTDFEIDEDAARAWAVRNYPGLLSFHLHLYAKVVRDIHDSKSLAAHFAFDPPPGTPVERPACKIAVDLAPYLPETP